MSAVFSACGHYRYQLGRTHGLGLWDSPRDDVALFLMLNPSKAGAAETDNDLTTTRCVGFSRALGCGRTWLGNLYAWISTDPRGLHDAEDPVGPDNDRHIATMVAEVRAVGGYVIAAWGAHTDAPDFDARVATVRGIVDRAGLRLHCLRRTASGHPAHPSRLPHSSALGYWP